MSFVRWPIGAAVEASGLGLIWFKTPLRVRPAKPVSDTVENRSSMDR